MFRKVFYIFVVFFILQLQFINCGSRISFKALDSNSITLDSSFSNGNNPLDTGDSLISGSRPISIVANPSVDNSSNGGAIVVNPNTKTGTNGVGSAGESSQTCAARTLNFDIYSKVTVTSIYSYSGEFLIDINQSDLSRTKYAFLAVAIGNNLSLYNFKTAQFVESKNISSYEDYGLALSDNRCDYALKLFDFKHADLSALGGYRVLAGYGVGSTADVAANEMVSAVRYREILNIPSQPASVSFVNMSNADAKLSGSAFVFVRTTDQLKKGYYFLAANSKDGNQWYMFSAGYWIKFDGNNYVSVNGLKELRNVSIPFTADLTNNELNGTKLYAGYVVSNSLAEAFQIFVNNSQSTRNTDPYVIEATQNKNSMDYLVDAYSSGAVNSYSIYSKIKIAEVHKSKLGYVFGVIQFQDKYYIYNQNTRQFVVYDGILAGFHSAKSLSSESTYVPFATSLDVIPFGGAKLFMGYGVGNTPSVAVNEMLSATRWREIGTIPVRYFSGSVSVPSYDKKSLLSVSIGFKLEVDYRDYKTPGKYYVVLCTSDNSKCNIFTGSSWVSYVGGSQDTNLYTSSTASLDKYNLNFSISGTELAYFSGYILYVGYGKSVTDMLEKKHFSSPVVIP